MEERIDEQTTVNDAIQRYPETVAVFNRFGVDACCGGASPMAEAAERDGVPLAELLEALREAVGAA
jgi:iron-sulfur cluster repair protein YtfE (RIC family)